jgi:peptidoglycan/xylan/chitin deacetylase (PgdA/CDA1 family)
MPFTRRPLHRIVTVAAAAGTVVAGAIALVTLTGVASAANTCSAGYVGITFDDGPSNDHTPALLNALRQNGLRATLFNEGQFAAQFPAQVQAEAAAGMWIGNHSYTHPHLIQQSQAQIDSELGRTQTAIANAGGGTPKLFRPPYGETNATLKSVEAKYGLKEIIWDVDSQDWNGASTAQIVSANNQLQNGQVILMHEWPANTLAAIPQIAANLNARNMCAGMISPTTGRAIAPGGGNPPPTTSSSGGGGSCTATMVPGTVFGDRYNTTVNVTASNSWIVTVTITPPQKISSTWNASVSWDASGNVMTARPNGSGNSFGFTTMFNGNSSARPSVSCRVG